MKAQMKGRINILAILFNCFQQQVSTVSYQNYICWDCYFNMNPQFCPGTVMLKLLVRVT